MASLSDAEFQKGAARTGECNGFRSLQRHRLKLLEDFFFKHRVVAQCYIAAMLSIVIGIDIWRYCNISMTFLYSFITPTLFSPLVGNWTKTQFKIFYYGSIGGEIFFQVPGALLIYSTSSHKFLTAAVAISSILHMLTPLCVHSGTFELIILSQKFVAAPLRIAVLSMWKDWVPSGKRTIFVFISFSILILDFPFQFAYKYTYDFLLTKKSFVISGVCGLAWSFLWFFTVSDIPPVDPRVPENELSCLPNNTFSEVKERPKLSEVPWKKILTSMPVFALCLVSFKIGSSFIILPAVIFILANSLNHYDNLYFYLVFAVLYAVAFTIGAILTDFLSRKFTRIIKIRKGTLSGVWTIHAILLLGMLIRNVTFQVTIFCLSYFIFSSTLAGFFTNALDISSQYVSVIGAFKETFYLLGYCLFDYYISNIFDYGERLKTGYPFGSILYYEIGFTILVAVIFQIWGSVEEQPWSVSTDSGNDYTNVQQFPEQEHELRELPERI